MELEDGAGREGLVAEVTKPGRCGVGLGLGSIGREDLEADVTLGIFLRGPVAYAPDERLCTPKSPPTKCLVPGLVLS